MNSFIRKSKFAFVSTYKYLLIIVFVLQYFNNNLISGEISDSDKKKVAILVYDEVYLLDFAGPLEIFNDTFLENGSKAFEVFLVTPEGKAFSAHTSTEISAIYSISNCPDPDILVIPGGNLNFAKEFPYAADWIKNTASKSEIVMSVCTGAFILADIGLLDGLEVITWYGAVDKLQKRYPKIKIQKGKRYTDNGKIITTAGVSAGIDGSLHVVRKLYGEEIANKTANYIEYSWQK